MKKHIYERKYLKNKVLDAIRDHQIVLIQAPAGYGKTLLAEALAKDPGAFIYRVTPWEAKPLGEALRDLIAAAHPGHPIASTEIEGGEGLRGLRFGRGLEAIGKFSLVIVDDVHLLDEGPLDDFLQGASQGLGVHARILVLTRNVPDFASGEMTISGRLKTFDARDMRFGEDEKSEAVQMGSDEDDAEDALRESEGWPTGFNILLHQPDEKSRVTDAVIKMIPEEDRDILMRSSIFDVIDDDSAKILSDDVGSRFVKLKKTGAMIEISSDRKFRLHPMIRKALKKKFENEASVEMRELHAKAAKAYVQSRKISTALEHLEASGDFDTIVSLRDHAISALIAGDVDVITKFAENARRSGFDDAPLFSFISAYRKKAQGLTGARDAFCEAATLSDGAGDRLINFESRIQIVENDLANGKTIEKKTMDEIVRLGVEIGNVAHSSALVRAGWSAMIDGKFADALSCAIDSPATGNIIEKTLMTPLSAYAKTTLGFFEEADSDMAAFLNEIEDLSPRIYGRMLVWAARLAWLRGDAAAAEEYAQHAHRLGEARHERVPSSVEAAWANLAPGLKNILRSHPRIGDKNAREQLGTMGGGNHFIEVTIDEEEHVWLVVHSGSRGVGNRIGEHFIERTRREIKRLGIGLEDSDLSYIVEGTDDFRDYLEAVGWAQDYAKENRRLMGQRCLDVLRERRMHLPRFKVIDQVIDVHHNYVAREEHYGENIWITRKGAVRAGVGEMGIIPGSMGARSYIVRGKGNPESFSSCSHGAGRLMNRGDAKQNISMSQFKKDMKGIEARIHAGVVDEAPSAYKDIEAVISAQSDLIEVVHQMRQILVVKG